MGTYTEKYQYDGVGNFLQFIHQGANPADPGWTRSFAYNQTSLLEPGKTSNRLSNTAISGNLVFNEPYTYDLHGSMASMPQLQAMQWSFKEELLMTQRQAVSASDQDGQTHRGERTYYVYDAAGQRVRKTTQSAAGIKLKERIYLGGFELYREYDSAANVTLARETLHVMDDKKRVALVETKTVDNKVAPGSLPVTKTRYQLDNHLGTACLELDENADVITYEEYYPYGSTSYQAGRTLAEVSLKRYRYIGKERDEETGLNYHGSRYYAEWLGRWTSADRIGIRDGVNLYNYARNNPLALVDRTGNEGTEADKPITLDREATKEKEETFITEANKVLTQLQKDNTDLQVEQFNLVQDRDQLGPQEKEKRAELHHKIDANSATLKLQYAKIEKFQEMIADATSVVTKIKAEEKAEERPHIGLDVSLQYNPIDLSVDRTGKTVNLPSGELQVVGLLRNHAFKKWDSEHNHLRLGLSEVSLGKEVSAVADFKLHMKDDAGEIVSPPSFGVQITAVDLAWKLNDKDFIEFGLPVQIPIIDTQGNVKLQAGFELDIHLDLLFKPSLPYPKTTVFVGGNIGEPFNNPDPDGQRRGVNSGSVGFGVKGSWW